MTSKKNSLVANMNRRKELGISRDKSDSTVSNKAYQKMQEGWPKSKKATKRASTVTTAKKAAG